jgi:3'-phosphoadenosine 5'-phosphosulfate sulfotransferase (PAPS reductase)/FAD synthetase
MTKPLTHWLSYGAGVNSTAVLVALLDGRIQADPWRIVWADTHDEKDETYDYVFGVIQPFLRKRGRVLEIVCGREGVLGRWERLSVTGSRLIRSCTEESKILPIKRHILAHGSPADVQLIGIHADEAHRAKPARSGELARRYPLIDLDWGSDECREAIEAAGLPVPVKSGCWHCPFMRRREIVDLAISAPCKFDRIVKLEDAANAKHPSEDGTPRMQWSKPAREIRDGGALFADAANDKPCACFDE